MKTALLQIFIAIITACSLNAEVIVGCDYWSDFGANAEYWLDDSDLYIIAHGDSEGFWLNCSGYAGYVPSTEIKHGEFAYYAMCDALCETGSGTVSARVDESIGYCEMDTEECFPCWFAQLNFQTIALETMAATGSARAGYNKAMLVHPECAGCVRYHSNLPAPPPLTVGLNIVPIIAPLLLRTEK